MTKDNFRSYIRDAKFRELFNSLGWNNYRGYADFDQIIDDTTFAFKVIAEYPGYQVIVCETDANITNSFCKRLDYKLRPQAQNYILIFKLPGTCHHVWAVPIKKTEKRDMVLVEYHSIEQTDFLFSKLDQLTFPLGISMNVVDVIARVQACFEVNSEKLTKDFYSGFQKQHTAFCKFITGIDDQIQDKENKNKQWYTSVMLNRLMFCYFIQKKGFLDNNKNYLKERLAWCQMQKGQDQFYGFYKSFLLRLFYDGINTPQHSSQFEDEFGRIPYLNGGMFDKHQLEIDYKDIDIKDEAFKQLFEFFDKWEWHLDTRVTASGKDINPDVLGYIFEQYINDRAEMGAYYTKEDITEYIGKNCILPFLMDRLKETDPNAFKPDGYVWKTLKESGSAYIYDAVKKGVEYFDDIPQEIAIGIDTTKPNLLERRTKWNDKTPDTWALPTEIWRETIERLLRCKSIQQKISNGFIHEINDFITYNLDIRQFVQNLLEKTDDHKLILHFYQALSKVTILDPTCGSGAFLFAALNILEPLYEVCIIRMREFNEQNGNLFKAELEELDGRYKSNVQYFIYKTIILHNLYGVDIMHEAVEIAKLRLFLKMVAVVDVDLRADNLGLDPLPDIDFNIRCGNTLVGYATETQLEKDLSAEGDMFANLEFKDKIDVEMDKVARTFDSFRAMQLSQDPSDMQAFKTAKKELGDRLTQLNDLLNHKLYMSNGAGKTYEKWLEDVQPFHWLAEYYQIIHGNGGFDVIIGNPPYVEYSSIRDKYKVDGYSCINSSNLYSFVIERSYKILSDHRYIGMIIPISAFCTARMESFISVISEYASLIFVSNYAERPSKLFEGAERNLSILLTNKNLQHETNIINTTYYYKWKAENRNLLFKNISYQNSTDVCLTSVYPKISGHPELSLLCKLRQINRNIGSYTVKLSNYRFYYKNSGGRYWKFMANFKPLFYLNNEKGTSSRETHLYFDTEEELNIFTAILNSSLYFWYYVMHSDARTNNPSDLKDFPIEYSSLSEISRNELSKLSCELMKEIQDNAIMVDARYKTGDVKFAQYLPAKSKPIIDNIDQILAQHYGFTEEELDFIINYDIKYRMGDELNEE